MTFVIKYYSSCWSANSWFFCYDFLQLWHFLSTRPPLRVVSQEWRRTYSNWRISTKSKGRKWNSCKSFNYCFKCIQWVKLSHSTTWESKSVSKRKNSRPFSKPCNIHLTQIFFTYWLKKLDLARMPSQGGGFMFKNLYLQFLRFIHPNTNEWNPTYKVWPPTPHTMKNRL